MTCLRVLFRIHLSAGCVAGLVILVMSVTLAAIASGGASLLVFTGLCWGRRFIASAELAALRVLTSVSSVQLPVLSFYPSFFVRLLFVSKLRSLLQCLAL
ncbi:MAG: hypothetical protein ACXVZH_07375 [Terriglobales bacterium]